VGRRVGGGVVIVEAVEQEVDAFTADRTLEWFLGAL